MNINESCVVIRPNHLNLDALTQLKDGQRVLAKIISADSDKALLQIAGNTIQAKTEGTPLACGSVYLFGVRLGDAGRIELKILANLNESGNEPAPGNQLLIAALKEQGLPATPANLQTINRLLSEIQLKFNFLAEPKIAAFLMARNLPLTLETFVMAWVQSDRKLRDYWWNQLDRAGRLDPTAILQFTKEPDKILKWFLGGSTSVFKEAQTNNQAKLEQGFRGEPVPPKQGENPDQTEEAGNINHRGELQKITELLTHRLNGDRSQGKNLGIEDYNRNLPLLVQDSQGRIRECVINWDEADNGRKPGATEQTVRLIIPTESLGDIRVILKKNAQSIRVNFEVESDAVKDYLWVGINQLQAMTGSQIKIGIETVQQQPADTGGMDLWI